MGKGAHGVKQAMEDCQEDAQRGPLASEDARETSDFIFQYVKGDTASSNAESIWTQSYQSNSPIPIGTAADSFPGGKAAFIAWFNSRASITHEEAVQHHLGPNAIWRKFMACFPLLSRGVPCSLCNDDPAI